MTIARRSQVMIALLLILAGASAVRAADRTPATQPVPDRAALEKQFASSLTNATLVGQYTIEGDAQPHNDRYTILKAVKGEGDNWVLTAKIEYKGFAVPIDITVPVIWAGDTPVIELTGHAIPGFGTFTARVLFYSDRYAGTWSAGPNHQGLMGGRIEHDAGKTTTKPGA